MKDIKGYKNLYAVTESGRIWSFPNNRHKKGKFLKAWLIGNGYQMVMLYKNKSSKKFLVHRLVAFNYITNPKKLREVNHINGKRLDNRVNNLEWVSTKDNHSHAWKLGLYDKNIGESHYLSKLNPDKVRKIRQLAKEGVKGTEIAKVFNISSGAVYDVVSRRNWKHII